jgi:hypothetical protein
MKSLQKVLIATTLTLALSATSFAGVISGGQSKTGVISGGPSQTGIISGGPSQSGIISGITFTEYVLLALTSVVS